MKNSIEVIESILCGIKEINPEYMRKKTRKTEIKEVRHLVIYFSYIEGHKYPELAKYYSQSNATVRNAKLVIENRIKYEPQYALFITECMDVIKKQSKEGMYVNTRVLLLKKLYELDDIYFNMIKKLKIKEREIKNIKINLMNELNNENSTFSSPFKNITPSNEIIH